MPWYDGVINTAIQAKQNIGEKAGMLKSLWACAGTKSVRHANAIQQMIAPDMFT
jgi:hypothetical protein